VVAEEMTGFPADVRGALCVSIKCRMCVLFVPLHGAKREGRENILLAAGYRGIRIERRNEMRIGFLTDSLHRNGDGGDRAGGREGGRLIGFLPLRGVISRKRPYNIHILLNHAASMA